MKSFRTEAQTPTQPDELPEQLVSRPLAADLYTLWWIDAPTLGSAMARIVNMHRLVASGVSAAVCILHVSVTRER